MNSVRSNIFKGAVILMAFQVITEVTALLKQLVIASWFGTSETMDGYLVAAAVVGLVQIIIARPIRHCLIPMFRHDLAQHGERTAWLNISILFNNITVLLVLVALAGWLSAPYLVALLAPGFEEDTKAMAVSITQITMVSIVFLGMGNVLSQLFFSYRKFLLPGSMGGVNNLVVIVTFFALGSAYGIHGLAVGVVLGALFQFVLQLPILWQMRRFYSLKVNFRHPAMIEMGKLVFPALFSTSGKQISRITDRIFASLLPVGSLSALAFASGLIKVLGQFLIEAPDQSVFPHLTKLSAERNFGALSRQLFNYLRIIFFVTLPLGIGAMVLAEPIVKVIYQRGAFDEASVRITSQALMFYAIGFPFAAISTILSRTFFGLKDTRTPTKVALLRHGTRIALSWVLIQHLGHRGIALADSVSLVISSCFLFHCLPAEVKGQEGWATMKSFGQTIGASILMMAVVYFAKEEFIEVIATPIELSALVLVGAATYATLASLTRRKDMQSLVTGITALLPNSLARKC